MPVWHMQGYYYTRILSPAPVSRTDSVIEVMEVEDVNHTRT